MKKTKKIVLLQGGMSSERQVSLSTGKGFEQALVELGYPYQVIDADQNLPATLQELKKNKQVDVALLALHGKYAEDGTVQGLLEYLKIPYSGSGVLASALCMDKILTKHVLQSNGLPTAAFSVVDTHKQKLEDVTWPHWADTTADGSQKKYRAVVKPSREGSSVGIHLLSEKNELLPALKDASRYDHQILIEQYIDGLEVTVPLFNNQAMTPIEIVPLSDFYNYENKYTAGKTEYYLPARIDEKHIKKIQELALKAFQVCGLRCYGRIDFRLSLQGEPFVIEINTLPGCTPTSLLPKSARHDGISFNTVIETLIETATLDYEGLV